ncbi:GNAT family N-acetyltransferase [Mucilaginibacter sp. KACC 22063]|uniref:GNAT family N-acetyltransferase n=1 Tax=Mucilaginibacter sp. KACC 22063 TaxID=3025666 RepID=UPI0023658CA2|nr:GNAT family N-acetyltransferase [Mucilaginibacter sp. KACC 22063]WDF56535.1 GNAT family N-acetyltransferase [Mucilaginibacter sp. KACC 22063]
MSEILIRKFRKTDIEELRNLYLSVRKDTFSWMDTDAFTIADFVKDTRDEDIWVAEIEGAIAGFISVWLPDSFVHHLYIYKQYQGKGIGRALLKEAESNTAAPLTLKCLAKNVDAFEFYIKLGWYIEAKEADEAGDYYLMSKV